MVLKDEVESRTEVKKSKFICLLSRVKSMDEAREFIARVRKDFPAATHYCTAVKIGSLTHSSDDGEPSGTAGRPMLDVLQNSDADEICAVVVRYFGGTLLGKGGLVRAYSGSVAQALEEAQFLEAKILGLYELCAGYDLAGRIESALHSMDLHDLECAWSDQGAVFTFASETDLSQELADRFSGSFSMRKLSEIVRES